MDNKLLKVLQMTIDEARRKIETKSMEPMDAVKEALYESNLDVYILDELVNDLKN